MYNGTGEPLERDISQLGIELGNNSGKGRIAESNRPLY